MSPLNAQANTSSKADSDRLTAQEYVLVGKITSAFGIKGWVKIYAYTDPRSAIGDYSPWLISPSNGESTAPDSPTNLTAITPLSLKPQGKVLVAQLPDCEDRTTAERYHGYWIWIKREQMEKLSDDGYYWRDLEGLRVINQQQDDLGRVHHLMETGANDVLVINPDAESIDNQQRLIPFVMEQFVLTVDQANGVVYVDWERDF